MSAAAADRIREYVALFISAEAQGKPWHYLAPVDGECHGDTLRLDGAVATRIDARSWRVEANGESVVLALRTPVVQDGAR